MNTPLRVLLVEDCEDDAALLVRELQRGGYAPTVDRVEDASGMAAALAAEKWDLILSDYTMPRFSGLAALQLLQQSGLDIPFILVSGTVGEEIAVEAMKAGASDYLVKSHLVRLAPAIERELREAEGRKERNRLANELLQAQKLESIGRLAGGVAHDFNNMLTAILGYAEMAQEECEQNSNAQAYLENITVAAEKAANLTGQLLAFARRQVIEPKPLNLNDLVRGVAPMLRRLIGGNIDLTLLPRENLHSVKVDAGQFEQILVNLVVNSRDAIQDSGRITIETDNVTLDAEYSRHHDKLAPGEYVALMVTDTGTGMDEAIQLHIFEPFFTTKEKGRGTGLGLATVYGIVKQAGGHIWLYSEPGAGATFKIYLPRTRDSVAAPSEPREQRSPAGGSEIVLLVEDEPSVRAMAARSLRGRGYTVFEAVNGEEAISVAEGREREIDLLVTDVVMPRMNGKDLASRLLSRHPGLHVLFASGYTENTIVHQGVLDKGIHFLTKPYTPTQLTGKVRDMLDGSTPPG